MNDKCVWINDINDCHDEYVYDSSCGQEFVFFEGGPEDNNFIFCPYCGKEIEVKDD